MVTVWDLFRFFFHPAPDRGIGHFQIYHNSPFCFSKILHKYYFLLRLNTNWKQSLYQILEG